MTDTVNRVSVSIFNIEFVLSGRRQDQPTWKLQIIVNRFLEEKKVRIPSDRTPTHPDEMLFEEFLKPLGMTQRALADAIHVPYQRVNEIVNERRGITPNTALRLAKYFGNSPGFWMNLQMRYDLYNTKKDESEEINQIVPQKTKKLLFKD